MPSGGGHKWWRRRKLCCPRGGVRERRSLHCEYAGTCIGGDGKAQIDILFRVECSEYGGGAGRQYHIP